MYRRALSKTEQPDDLLAPKEMAVNKRPTFAPSNERKINGLGTPIGAGAHILD
jgi:hypothetical protein